VRGPFIGTDDAPYLLIGKYEVTRLQVQAMRAQATGARCPQPDATADLAAVTSWDEAVAFADQYSRWLAEQAGSVPECRDGLLPCLPRVDGVAAFVRLPLAAEWEYAARGGLAVTTAQFAAPRYPIPAGLEGHAWYAANANGTIRPIGQRAPSPLGLHDLYGNVSELMLAPYGAVGGPGQRGAALARGGDAGSAEASLGAAQQPEVPLYGQDATLRTGLRLLASVPVYTSHRVSEPDPSLTGAGPAQPPLPVKFFGKLRVTGNVPAEVRVDGKVMGRATPEEPLALEGVEVGER
jgi:hypothetical protein